MHDGAPLCPYPDENLKANTTSESVPVPIDANANVNRVNQGL